MGTLGKAVCPGAATGLDGRHTLRRGEGAAAYLLLVPILVLFCLSVVYPLAETLRLSLFDIRGMGVPRFVGWGNYVNLFSDDSFRRSIWTTLIWSVSTTGLSVSAGWLLAMLCSFAPTATAIPRAMIFAAYGMAETVTGFAWSGIYRADDAGLLNALLAKVGLANWAHAWLGDPSTALGAVAVAYAWAQTGLPLMLCFAAAQAIPKSILEAAYMDGAGPFAVMRHIIMPLSLPGVRVAIFMNLLSSLRAFDTIYVMTGGGPVRATETVGYFMFRESMNQFKLGYGAAATVVLLAAVCFVSVPAIIQRTAGAK
ncbi:sugar ABC transporter permease [Trinickia terrae]|uniref:Sugar ABC transporter permease n=1 Tax=Trinickia terrae TaxID=2571161 RepID=A0A4U1I680_9BURK|nr:sugar ABC transporter permease [Trinickia terrae]TKC88767.1 sugar ABC transporter permease [Trinickia terrae]